MSTSNPVSMFFAEDDVHRLLETDMLLLASSCHQRSITIYYFILKPHLSASTASMHLILVKIDQMIAHNISSNS